MQLMGSEIALTVAITTIDQGLTVNVLSTCTDVANQTLMKPITHVKKASFNICLLIGHWHSYRQV